MSAVKKSSQIQKAYERCQSARDALNGLRREGIANCMEVVEDKCGIVCERWYVARQPDYDESGKCVRYGLAINLVLYSTPDWWDVFSPLTQDPEIDAMIAAIKALVK